MTDESGFRKQVAAEREATEARVVYLSAEIEGIVAASADANADDEHDPEGATIAFERARASTLLADAEAHLLLLDRAAARIEAGTYDVCLPCGGPIATDRLAARPGVVTCIGCAASPTVDGSESDGSPAPTRPGGPR
jgi:DnaK suppressor protein